MDELYQLLKPTDSYYQQWQRFRRGLRLRTTLCFVPGIFFVVVFLAVAVVLARIIAPVQAQSVGILVGLIVSLAILHWYPLQCPRCGKRFFGFVFHIAQYWQRERCLHCGLQLYAPNDLSEAA